MELELEQLIEKYNLIDRTYKSLNDLFKLNTDIYNDMIKGKDKDKFEYVLDYALYEIYHTYIEKLAKIRIGLAIKYDDKSLYRYIADFDLQGEIIDDWWYGI